MSSNVEERVQAFAAEIKEILCKIFDCTENSIWCVSVADHPYFAMVQGLARLSTKQNARDRILYSEHFATNYYPYKGLSLADIISCDSDKYQVGTVSINFDAPNGETFLRSMIDEFKKIADAVIDA